MEEQKDHQHKKQFVKKFFDGFVVLLECSIVTIFLLLSVLAALPILPTKQYLQTYIVPTGSMSPIIPVGALAFTSPALRENVEIGDVIAFIDPQDKQKTVLHRIINVKVIKDTIIFQTKGDHNNGPDPWIVEKPLVRAEFLFALPYIGYLMSFLKTELGFFLCIGIPAVLLIGIEFKHIREAIDEEVNKKIKEKSSFHNFSKYFFLFFALCGFFLALKADTSAQGILVVSKELGHLSVSTKADEQPILVVSRSAPNQVQFEIHNISAFESLVYSLTYDTDTIAQEVQGQDKLQGQKKYSSSIILLGTCSSGVCVYDKGVHNGHLRIILKGKTFYSVISQAF